jgi:hypothetical protein
MDEQNNIEPAKKSQTGPLIAIVGIIVIVVAGIIGYQNMNKSQSQTQAVNTTQKTAQTETKPTVTTAVEKSAFKDGTYKAIGSYISPGGQEELGVSLTVANDVITDSQVTVEATRPESKERQEDFAANYKTQVVGKNLAELQLSKVSGSSLSPKGFNDAVEKIKAEAKS